MGYKFIELEVADTIGILTLARTERLNALSLEFAAEITGAVKELWDTDEVRVIILASNAQIFCAGLDLKSFISLHELFDCCDVLEECPKPLIAAVHGQCMGDSALYRRRDLLSERNWHRTCCRHGSASAPSPDNWSGFYQRNGLYCALFLCQGGCTYGTDK